MINERIIKAAIEFAKLSIHLVSKDEPRLAIEMAEKYLQGEVSEEEVRAATDAAYATRAANSVAYAAYAAAHTAAYAAAYAAANAAVDAAYIAVYADATYAVYAADTTADAIAYASGFEQDTKEWHLNRLEVLKQCLVIAKRTFGLIR